MGSRFYNISKEEMHRHLTQLGFVPMTLPGVVELVYGRVLRVGNHKLSLRVYTAINPSGESREMGSDAIRLQLFAMVNGTPTMVGRTQKCLRVKTWETNLASAIRVAADPHNFRLCAACGHPMVIRVNGQTGNEFWGCTMYHTTGCKGKPAGETALPQQRKTGKQGKQVKPESVPPVVDETPPWEKDDS